MYSYTEHNNITISKYWKDYDKTGESHSMARCWHAVRGGSIYEKISSFQDMMYVRDENERKKHLFTITRLLFEKEIMFIFENRRVIRNGYNISWTGELFRWMNLKDIIGFALHKESIKKILLHVANSDVKLTKDEIISTIISYISQILYNSYIYL